MSGKNSFNGGLIYPNINLTNTRAIKSHLLVFDKLYRIVPNGYKTCDNPEIKELAEEYGVIKDLPPDPYVDAASEGFKERLDEWSRTAVQFGDDVEEREEKMVARLHSDKVNHRLKEIFEAKGLIETNGQWLKGDIDFINQYMLYLANEASCRESLSLLTDNIAAFTYQEFMNHSEDYDGDKYIEDLDYPQQLASVIMDNYVPADIELIPNSTLMEFRDKFRDERKNFFREYDSIQQEFSKSSSPTVLKDRLIDRIQAIDSSMTEYRRSIAKTNRGVIAGSKIVSTIAVASEAVNVIFPLDSKVRAALTGSSLVIGAIWGMGERKNKAIEESKKNPYSYLHHMNEYDFDSVYTKDALTLDIGQLILD